MLSLKEFKRQLIIAHPTFFCPVSKSILDIDKSHIISYNHPSGKVKVDVISCKGWEMIPQFTKDKLDMKIINSMEELP